MLKKEEISQAHPVLELYPETVKCILFGQIKKINTKKQIQLRYLLISNAALFLLVKKKFPSGFRLSRFITYKDISQITITNGSDHPAIHGDENANGANSVYIVSIYTKIATDDNSNENNSQHLSLQFEMNNPKELSEVIARILIIKSSYFPNSKDVLSSSTPEFLQDMINQSSFLFESNSIFADRFLSLCVMGDLSPQLNNQIIELYNQLSEINNEVYFTSQMLSYIFITQFTEAIAKSTSPPLHDKPFEVHFNKGNYEKIAKCLQILFKDCSFMEKIIFNGVIFSSLDNPIDLFSVPHQTSLNTITFINCNLKSNDFKHLINDLNHFQGKITTLEIHDCDIDEHNLKHLFNTIFDAKCFRHLKTLSLSGIEEDVQLFIMQFMGSNNVLKNKTIETLNVNDSNLAIENILLNISLFETGLQNLILTKCKFIQPISPNVISTFQQLQVIDLSNSKFASIALLSLFRELSSVASNDKSPAPSSLILDNVDIPSDDLPEFYTNLNESFVINTLKSFSWSGNRITENDIDPFFSFLKKQSNLTQLNISFSLNFEHGQIDENEEISDAYAMPFSKISSFVSSMNLQSIKIRGKKQTAYKGEYFNLILGGFCENLDKIKEDETKKDKLSKIDVDVRGHRIGEEGIEMLTKLVNDFPSLNSIYFNHTGAPIESIITIITAMLDTKSSIQSTIWPEKDIKDALHKVNPSDRTNFLNTSNELKKKFEQRFGKSAFPKSQSSISDGAKAAGGTLDRSSSKGKFFVPSGQLPPQNLKTKKSEKNGKVAINAAIPTNCSAQNNDNMRKRGCTTAVSNSTPKLINMRNENTNSVSHGQPANEQALIIDYLDSLVSMKEHQISSLLIECIGADEVEIKSDPLVITIQNIIQSLELPSI